MTNLKAKLGNGIIEIQDFQLKLNIHWLKLFLRLFQLCLKLHVVCLPYPRFPCTLPLYLFNLNSSFFLLLPKLIT